MEAALEVAVLVASGEEEAAVLEAAVLPEAGSLSIHTHS